jgi:chaperone required for assembly of F1-ATPase
LHIDLALCSFRGRSEDEAGLVELQQQYHEPMIAWFQRTFQVPIKISEEASLIAPEQSETTINTLRWYLHRLDDWQLGW